MPPLIPTIIVLVLLLVTWVAGSIIRLKTMDMVWITLGLLLLAGLAWLVWWLLHRRRKAGSDPAAGNEGVRAMREHWHAALAALRSAALGQTVLRDSPWYLVIGGPGSGKTSLLANSGLGFSTVGGTSAVHEVRPTGSFALFRNDQAVFVDTAGRYLGDPASHREWLALLRLIAKTRKGLPVQGVLIAIPFCDLLRKGVSAASVEANLIRDRLHEVAQILGCSVPVYAVITKADQLGGFKEFFASTTMAEREQILGMTMPWPPDGDVLARFSSEHERLADALADRRVVSITCSANASPTATDSLRKLVQFPGQYQASLRFLVEYFAIALRPGVGFISTMRGCYLTSSLQLQTGTAIHKAQNAAMATPNPAEGTLFITPTAAGGADPGPADCARRSSFFVRDLLNKVVIPDRILARATPRAQRNMRIARVCCILVVPLIAAALIGSMTWSTLRSSRLLDDLRLPAQSLREAESARPMDAARILKQLDALGDRLKEAAQADDARLDPAVQAVSAIYVRNLRPLLLDACIAAVEKDLDALSTGKASAIPTAGGTANNELYDLFRCYQMLGGAMRANPEVVKRALLSNQRWFAGLALAGGPTDLESKERAARQLDVVAYGLLPARLLQIDTNRRVVDNLNRELGEGLWLQQAYDDLMRQVTPQYGMVRPETLLTGAAGAALTTTSEVSLVYSQEAWDDAVEHAIAEKAESLERSLAEIRVQRSAKDIARRLTERFLADHNRHWLEFIASTRAAQVRDFRDSAEQIDRITGADSPYPAFIRDALGRLNLKTGISFPSGDDLSWVKPALHQINGLKKDIAGFLQATESGKRSSEVDQLKKLVERFNATSTGIGELLANMQPSEKRAAVQKGLDTILLSLFAALDQEFATEHDRLWNENVARTFAQRYRGRFPFAQAGDGAEDVSLADFQRFFNPVSGTLWRTLIPIEGMRNIRVLGRPSVTLSREYESSLLAAKTIRDVFFQGNSETLSIQFTIVMQQRQGVQGMLFQAGSTTHSLYDRPDARYTYAIKQGDPTGSKVSIQLVTNQWKSADNNRGDWGFLKLLQSGNPVPANGGGFLCTWTFDGSAAMKDTVFKASVLLESTGFEKAVVGGLLTGFDVPPHIYQSGSKAQ